VVVNLKGETMDRRQMIASSVFGMAAVLLGAPFFVGCGVAGALPVITLGLNLVGTILPTIPGIIASISTLAGHGVLTQAQVAKLTAVFTGVQSLFQEAESTLTTLQSNNDPTLIAKIKDIMTQIQTQLSTVLTDVQITDPGTVTKITAIVNSFIDLAANVLTILPVVSNGKIVAAKKPTNAQMRSVTPEAWAERFNRAIALPSGNPIADAAFAPVKAVPKK
jgi:hypothetical protein